MKRRELIGWISMLAVILLLWYPIAEVRYLSDEVNTENFFSERWYFLVLSLIPLTGFIWGLFMNEKFLGDGKRDFD